jgi:hypothetical protein
MVPEIPRMNLCHRLADKVSFVNRGEALNCPQQITPFGGYDERYDT